MSWGRPLPGSGFDEGAGTSPAASANSGWNGRSRYACIPERRLSRRHDFLPFRPCAISPSLAAVRSEMHHQGMTKYLISFPSEAMVIPDEELPIVSAEAHAVIEEAKAAGVYVFGGGIEEQVDPVLVSGDGSVFTEIYPGSELKGGFTVLELPTREEAVEWARRIAVACRCSQELREFMYDPAS